MSDDNVSAEAARGLLEKATPGPWRSGWDIEDTSDEVPLIFSESTEAMGDAGKVVFGMWYDGLRSACTEQNAALLAAAPDLARTVIALHAEAGDLRARVEAVEAEQHWLRRILDIGAQDDPHTDECIDATSNAVPVDVERIKSYAAAWAKMCAELDAERDEARADAKRWQDFANNEANNAAERASETVMGRLALAEADVLIMRSERDEARRERDRLALEVKGLNGSTQDRMLSWLGLDPDEVCRGCGGVGRRTYADTSTWRRGRAGGQQMTPDVCDSCWGTGSTRRVGVDLRKMSDRVRSLEAENATEHYRAQRELLLSLWREMEGDQDGDAPGNHLLEDGLIAGSRRRDEHIASLESELTDLSDEVDRLHALLDQHGHVECDGCGATLPPPFADGDLCTGCSHTNEAADAARKEEA